MAISIRDFLSDGYKGDQGPIGYTGSAGSSDADTLDGQHGSYYTGYTDTAIANLIDTAPTTLDTLNELAAALGDDPNFATTVTNSISGKVSKSGDTIDGNLSVTGDLTIDTNTLFVDATNNRVGIGTSSPDQILSIVGKMSFKTGTSTRGLVGPPSWDGSYISIQNGTLAENAANAALFQNSLGVTSLNASSGQRILFKIANAEHMRIDSTGNVGIGSTSPATALDVVGTVTADGLTVQGDAAFGGAIDETVYVLSGTTPALNPSNGTIQTHTLTGNTTYSDSIAAGESITIMIDDGTDYTVTWPTVTWVDNGGIAPTLATTGYTVVVLWKVNTTLYGALVGNGV